MSERPYIDGSDFWQQCLVEDTFDRDKLENPYYDACLEDNPFMPVSPDLLEVDYQNYAETEVEATWYGPRFEYRPAKNEEIFIPYGYGIAVTEDLFKDYPLGSFVKIEYEVVNELTSEVYKSSVIARVIDEKPFEGKGKASSIDLSKAVVYALGRGISDQSGPPASQASLLALRAGPPASQASLLALRAGGSRYNLLTNGRNTIRVKLHRLKMIDAGTEYSRANVFFRLGEWEYKGPGNGEYKDVVDRLWALQRYVVDNVEGYKGYPAPHLALVHKEVNGAGKKRDKVFVQLRFGPIRSADEERFYYESISPFVEWNDALGLELVESSEPAGSNVRHAYFAGALAARERRLDRKLAPDTCRIRPRIPIAMARDNLAELAGLPLECLEPNISAGTWDARPSLLIDFGAELCFASIGACSPEEGMNRFLALFPMDDFGMVSCRK